MGGFVRLLTVSHFYESHGGGIERVAAHLCRAFSGQGHKAVWAASSADAVPADIATVPLACRDPLERLTGLPMPLPGPRALRDLARAIDDADAVIVHDALYVTSIAALVMARRRGKRVVLVQHIAAIPFASRLMRGVMALANLMVTRPMLAAADEVVFISDTVRQALLGSPPRRSAHLAFNGVDHAIFNAAGPVAQPGPSGAKRVLFAGRYVAKKGLAVLRACAQARPDWQFVLAGSGPLRPADWGLANVTDLGPQSPQALAALYRGADVLLLPSVGEGYPLVIQEAMACGLPVVCGAPAQLADPAAGKWLAGAAIDLARPDASAQACIAAIETLAVDEAARVAMADYASRTYSWPVMAARLAALAAGAPLKSAR
ncbi:glycosyltransferase family 4 protein [Novosphingobium colocasiae]